MNAETAEELRQALLAVAVEFGFRLEYGAELDDDTLRGRWWWSLTQCGWSGIETGDTFATQREAEDNMIVAHCCELMEG